MTVHSVALVTGCSTGIGRALAISMSEKGIKVYATARNAETVEPLRNERLIPLQLDVLSNDSIETALATVAANGDHIDILVNNAGLSITAPLVETDISRIKKLFDTNLLGCIALIQAVFPHMADRQRGRIINVGSVVGELPTPYTAAYCASKAGLHMLSDVLRMELKPFGIEVCTVQPAAVSTEIETRSAEGIDAFTRPESRYRQFYASIRHRFEGNDGVAMSADEFARRITPRLIANKCPRTVAAGGNNNLLQLLSRLPVKVRDALLAREYGL